MFKYDYKIKFHDVDAAKIVFFGNVYKIAHDAYQEMLNGFELKEDYFTSENYVIPIVHSEAEYFSPLKFNQDIKIKISVLKIGESSFELRYDFMDEKDYRYVCVKTVHVLVDKKSFKKTKLTDDILKMLQTVQ